MGKKPLSAALDLSLVDSCDPAVVDTLEETKRAFDEGDAEGLFVFMDNTKELQFVLNNLEPLFARGIYEAALFNAYVDTRTNLAAWRLEALEFFFRLGDREKLLEVGDPLPSGDRFTLYRGVSGVVPFRKVSGMSWTRDLDKAIWFAERYGKLLEESNAPDRSAARDPAVYATVAKPSDVFCYSNSRNEDDFIMRARRYKRMDPAKLEKGQC